MIICDHCVTVCFNFFYLLLSIIYFLLSLPSLKRYMLHQYSVILLLIMKTMLPSYLQASLPVPSHFLICFLFLPTYVSSHPPTCLFPYLPVSLRTSLSSQHSSFPPSRLRNCPAYLPACLPHHLCLLTYCLNLI